MPPVVTRFAPSPTGYLHIGGARTALFNWALARQHGPDGKYLLRIEDTDKARSTAEATRRIIEDMVWLGLTWDEGPDPDSEDPYAKQIGDRGPYFQSQRDALYREAIDRLFAMGRAYKCFKTPQQLTAEREAAKREKRPYKYDRTESCSLTPEQVAQYEREGRPFVVRFRMPDEAVTVHDLVLGDVTIQASELEDLVIVKSDGGPTFHLANVVDDHHMGVTHVLRAQEHLMNTPKHVALFDALGWPRPRYAHMPLIFNPDGTKMSKRDKAKVAREATRQRLQNGANVDDLAGAIGAAPQAVRDFVDKKSDDTEVAVALADHLGVALPEIDVHDFRKSGYLPHVLLNYVALLGWSPGNDIERFDMDFLVKNFSLERIGKSNAKFDREKLFRFNAEAVAALSPDEFAARLREHFAQFHPEFLQRMSDAQFRVFADSNRERSRTLSEPAQTGRFFIVPDDALPYDEKAVEKVLEKNNREGFGVLDALRPRLAALDPWDADAINALVKSFAEEKSLGLGKVAQPLRVAVSGSTVSPPIDATLVILGKASTLARIDRCLTLTPGA